MKLRSTRLRAVAVRFMDDVIEVSNYPLPQQREEALSKRRIGLGITGLADALAMCGLAYGTPEAASTAGRWMGVIERAAYRQVSSWRGSGGLFRCSMRSVSARLAMRRDLIRSPG